MKKSLTGIGSSDVGQTALFSSISYTVSQALMPPLLTLNKMPCGCIVLHSNTSAGHVCPAHPQLSFQLSLPFVR